MERLAYRVAEAAGGPNGTRSYCRVASDRRSREHCDVAHASSSAGLTMGGLSDAPEPRLTLPAGLVPPRAR
jgi:hypothetical protein